MTDRKKPGVAFWATVGLVVVLTVYPTSYACMVKPYSSHVTIQVSGVHATGFFPLYTQYSPMWGPGGLHFGECDQRQCFLEKLFRPVHWLDRKIRPDTWADR